MGIANSLNAHEYELEGQRHRGKELKETRSSLHET